MKMKLSNITVTRKMGKGMADPKEVLRGFAVLCAEDESADELIIELSAGVIRNIIDDVKYNVGDQLQEIALNTFKVMDNAKADVFDPNFECAPAPTPPSAPVLRVNNNIDDDIPF